MEQDGQSVKLKLVGDEAEAKAVVAEFYTDHTEPNQSLHDEKKNENRVSISTQKTSLNESDEITEDIYRDCQEKATPLLTSRERGVMPSLLDDPDKQMPQQQQQQQQQDDESLHNQLFAICKHLSRAMSDVFYDSNTFNMSTETNSDEIDQSQFLPFPYSLSLPTPILSNAFVFPSSVPISVATTFSSPIPSSSGDQGYEPVNTESEEVVSELPQLLPINDQTVVKAFIMFHLMEGLQHFLRQSIDIISDYELVRYVINEEYCVMWLQQHAQNNPNLSIGLNSADTASTDHLNKIVATLLQRRRNLIRRLHVVQTHVFQAMWNVLCEHQSNHQKQMMKASQQHAEMNGESGTREPLTVPTGGYYDANSDSRAVQATNDCSAAALMSEMYEYSNGEDSCTSGYVRCCCLECRCCAAFCWPFTCPLKTCYIFFCCPCYCYTKVRWRRSGAWNCCYHEDPPRTYY